MDTFTPDVLTAFLTDTAPGRALRTRQRDVSIVDEITDYLDSIDVTGFLGTHPAALLQYERELGGVRGSFLRIFGAAELVCCLPGYLEAAVGPAGMRIAKVALVGRLLRWIRRRHLLDGDVMCAFYEAEDAVVRARRSVRTERQTGPPGDG